MLLTVLLFLSLLTVAAVAVAPNFAREIRRDQETELIHRAIQYRRAIRQFSKKTGRYPMKIEDLEDTNGARFLRRRYKDPITGGDFRLLHMSDIPAATGTSSNSWSLQPGKDTNGTGDGSTPEQDQSGNAETANSQPTAAAASSGTGFRGSSSSSNSNSGNSSSANNPSSSNSANTTFGGGVIIGVASASKKKTIREFDSRNHYNQWLFFYDPGFDRPFEVQGPTPLTHPPNLQNSPNSSSAGQSAFGTTPNSANPGAQNPGGQNLGGQNLGVPQNQSAHSSPVDE